MAIFVLGRIIFGAYFAYWGFNHFKDEKMLAGYAKSKGIPSPRLAVLVTGAMLIVGGIGFIFGEHLYEAAIILLIFMIPTTFAMHAFWKISDHTQRMNDMIAFSKNMAIIGALLMML